MKGNLRRWSGDDGLAGLFSYETPVSPEVVAALSMTRFWAATTRACAQLHREPKEIRRLEGV
jgi:hypothetical protein